jgi:hypothetical protein
VFRLETATKTIIEAATTIKRKDIIMNSMQEVAQLVSRLNNGGIQCMNEGKYENAVETISNALAYVKTRISSEDNDNVDEISSSSSCPEREHRTAGIPRSVMVKLDTASSTTTTTTKTMESLHYCYIHTNPIVLEQPDQSCAVTFRYLTIQSFILLYNLALAYHLYAMQQYEGEMTSSSSTSVSHRALRKAASLYEIAYNFHETEAVQSNMIQMMAMMNNLGHIYHLLQQPTIAKRYFHNLLRTIMYVNTTCGQYDDSRYRAPLLSSPSQQQQLQQQQQESNHRLEGFIYNALSFTVSEESTAAAA